MVMPLGPDFAKSLLFSEASIGYVGGSYTAAACLSGLLGSMFLDRFDRRRALFCAMVGLVTATALGGFARGFGSLIAARLLAGSFGGPATALSIAIISDAVPASLRGRALGMVMGAFSIASVLGVPMGLWAAEQYDWRAPFFAVAAMGLVVTVAAVAALPAMRGHLERKVAHPVSTAELLSRPLVWVTYAMVASTMMAGFLLIPNISGYLQLNLDVKRETLKYLYLCGGVASFFAMQLAGWLVDRFGSFRTNLVGTGVVAATIAAGFWAVPPLIPPVVLFVAFMTGMALRNISYQTLNTRVPEPEVRARFQSLSSAVQHGASALAAMVSAQLLTRVPRPAELPGHTGFVLLGMQHVAMLSLTFTFLIPVLLRWVELRVNARGAGRPESLIPKAAVR
ncbi:MAG: MFS transporter [Archangiaceae bacterium]|nr:MFS transporter [Archangiaceae bacterium]